MSAKSSNKTRKLTEPQKAYVVQCLACFDSPKDAADSLKEHYGIEITPQSAEAYDPNKRAGQSLAKKWRDLFEQTRKDFLANAESHIPIANKTVRLREIQKAYTTFKARGNLVAAMQALEAAAKEMGNVHTNKRELTGKDGKPIEVDYTDMTEDQANARLLELLGTAGIAAGEHADPTKH